MATVEMRHLTKTFRSVRAVDDVTFSAPPGAVTGFLGPNGSGKTTTIRMALGLIRPTSGEALIDGKRYTELSHPRRIVGAMLDASGLHPGRTGRDHLCVLASDAGIGKVRIEEVLDQVDLTDAADRRVRGYSLGMKQRLGLASALLGDPEILILDEPANGLDPAGIAWLRTLLRAQAASEHTVIVSSHVLSEVEQTVDQVVIVSNGQLRFDGSLAELDSGDGSLEAGFLRLTTEKVAA
jgi:ABC-2 type transport system ATP-binding protein